MENRELFYGRRKGRPLRTHKQKLLDETLTPLKITLPPEGKSFDPLALFAHHPSELWLEFGFGGGEHLAEMAAQNPDKGLIGCEAFVNGIASLLKHIEARQLSNIRIWPQDGRSLLHRLPDHCLDKMFILFPDPWPKVRHHKRRFIQPQTLDTCHRLLKKGAELRIASDDQNYIEWILECFKTHPKFIGVKPVKVLQTKPVGWPSTRYEQKALKEGKPCTYLSITLEV